MQLIIDTLIKILYITCILKCEMIYSKRALSLYIMIRITQIRGLMLLGTAETDRKR